MSQTVNLWGATYSNVPAINVPTSPSGTARFTDVTDTTAVAGDVVQGKYFYLANGTRVEGTSTGGSGDGFVWQDGQGYVHLSDEESENVEIPVFSLDMRPSTPVVTCNKTFVECYALYNSNTTAVAMAEITTTQGFMKMAMSAYVAYANAYMCYAIYSEVGEPVGDITFYANDTGTFSTPSALVGSAGTPTATKGTVSNHAVSVTPSVTNTKGFISGGTKTGTAVSVSASELVSGTYSVTSSGTKDVTNYASASVPAGTATAPTSITGTSATVSTGTNTITLSKTVSVTPRITTAGYVSSGTAGNASVSLTGTVTTHGAQTLYPSTSDQTITGS